MKLTALNWQAENAVAQNKVWNRARYSKLKDIII